MSESRHKHLIRAGWVYDDSQDRYRAPGSMDDGTATLYNQAAAWEREQARQLDSASTPAPSPRAPDPRHKEPE